MKTMPFINNEIYHLYNRGVDKRKIFIDDGDRLRFIHDLFEFNDEAPALNLYYRLPDKVELRKIKIERAPRKLLVKIIAFCLMPNHFHLLVEQNIDKGITHFMRKLGTGYTNYFNQKYERSGALFQGQFKAVVAKNQSHFIHLPYYIHFNPLDLVEPDWRNRKIKNYNQAVKFLRNYRWSSYLDYIGIKNFPSVTQREFLMKLYKDAEDYKKESFAWLKDLALDSLDKLTLE